MLDLKKILEKSGIDINDLVEESKRVPQLLETNAKLLEALVKEHNAGARVINEMTKRIFKFQQELEGMRSKLNSLSESINAMLERENG